MACLDRYADAADYRALMCGEETVEADTKINTILEITAVEINADLASIGACDCTLSKFGLAFLKKINIVMAALLDQCPCARNFTDTEKHMWADWISEKLTLIRSGEIELCDGYTGSTVPTADWIEVGWTPWNAAKIISNDVKRRS